VNNDIAYKLKIINQVISKCDSGVNKIELLGKPKNEKNVDFNFYYIFDSNPDQTTFEFNEQHIYYLIDLIYNICMQEIKLNTLGISRGLLVSIEKFVSVASGSVLKQSALRISQITDNVLWEYKSESLYKINVRQCRGKMLIDSRTRLMTPRFEYQEILESDTISINCDDSILLQEAMHNRLLILNTQPNQQAEMFREYSVSATDENSSRFISDLWSTKSTQPLTNYLNYKLIKYHQLSAINLVNELIQSHLLDTPDYLRSDQLNKSYEKISKISDMTLLALELNNWYESEKLNKYSFLVSLDNRTEHTRYIKMTDLYKSGSKDRIIENYYIELDENYKEHKIDSIARGISDLSRYQQAQYGIDLSLTDNDTDNYEMIKSLSLEEQDKIFKNISIHRIADTSGINLSTRYIYQMSKLRDSIYKFISSLLDSKVIDKSEYSELMHETSKIKAKIAVNLYTELHMTNRFIDTLSKYINT
jgi:hypothetical protein